MKQTRKRICRASIASLFCATVLASTLPALPASAATATLVGDVTLDGSVNLSDVVAAQQYLLNRRTLSPEAGANADYNADNVCNVIDLVLLKRDVLNKIDPVNDAITIHLSDSGITVENDTNGVTSVSGKTVTITASGNYKVDGSIADGQIFINIPDTTADAGDVELFLNDVTMTSSTGAPCIYTQSAVKTKLTVSGTNTFTDTAFAANATTSGVIYADGKLTVTKNSTGVLDITSSMNVGLYSTKNMNLNGGTIQVNTDVDTLSDADAIKTKNTLTVEGATVKVESSADGLKSTQEQVDVISGSVTVKAGNDAVQAATAINISGGTVIAGGDRGFRLDDLGTLNITGGDVLATATDYQLTGSAESVDLSGSTQGIMMLDFAAEQSKNQTITVQQNGTTVYEMTTNKKCSYALLSGSGITASGNYTTAVSGAAQGHLPTGSTTQESSFVMSGNAAEFYSVSATGSVVTPSDDNAVATISFSDSGVKLLNASGSDVTASAEGITANGSTVTITVPGSFDVTGDSSNARIEVNVDKTTYATGVVELLLKNANLSNSTMAPIYVEAIGDEVVLNSVSGTVNTISDGTSHTDTYVDSEGVTNTVNGAVFSRDDMKLKGSGSLTINGNTEDGLVCKNDLKLYNGTITVNAVDDGIRGNDSVTVGNDTNTDFSNLNITVTSTGDGIKATNDTDAGEGTITVNGGTINLHVLYDGFQAVSDLTVNGGSIDIYTFEGSTFTGTGGSSSTTPGGGFGGGGFGGSDGNANKVENSAKGMKSDGTLNILGGTIQIDSSDDALHSAGDMNLFGGTLTLASADDGAHSDTNMIIGNSSANTFDDIKIYISYCYEGIEGTNITQNSGTVVVNSVDDGYNAAGGADGSGSTSPGGWGQGGTSSGGNYALTINGGIALVNATDGDHDGFDSNGSLTIAGGYVISNGNETFDSDGSLSYTGGVYVAEGSSNLTKTVSASGSASAGTRITLADSSNNVIVSFIADKSVSQLNAGCSGYSSAVFYTGGTVSGGTLLTEGFGTQSIYVDGTISGGSALSSSSGGGGNMPW
ncbi:MAG: carbohydrate-binding domain-containing protein [Ruminococcus sp.]